MFYKYINHTVCSCDYAELFLKYRNRHIKLNYLISVLNTHTERSLNATPTLFYVFFLDEIVKEINSFRTIYDSGILLFYAQYVCIFFRKQLFKHTLRHFVFSLLLCSVFQSAFSDMTAAFPQNFSSVSFYFFTWINS